MSIILDYASPARKTKLAWLPQDYLAAIFLTICVPIYFLACRRAMAQRGFPPIDLVEQGQACLWIGGVALTACVQRFSRRRVNMLFVYAVATSYIDSAANPMMVPN